MNPSSPLDRAPDRTGSDSLKWSRYAGRDIIPLWVADMDFQSPPAVVGALKERVEHGVFGYAVATPETTEAVVRWMQTRHQWTIRPDWIVWLPGLVSGLNLVCRAFSDPNQPIAVNTPIYPPFLTAPTLSGRPLVRCPLKREHAFYTLDYERLIKTLSSSPLFLFCSPHNPTGRLWTKQELETVAEICLQKNTLLCSDEIHADLVLESGGKHIPAASLSPEIAAQTITLGSPGKTFNLPGLNCGYAIIPNPQLRKRFLAVMRGIIPHVNALGYAACRAAYTEGAPWLAELLDYLRDNQNLVSQTVTRTPGLSMSPPQATYLAWIDCRPLGLADPAGFFEDAGVGLSDGAEFDAPGFVRLNFACPRSRLAEALRRIQKALSDQTF